MGCWSIPNWFCPFVFWEGGGEASRILVLKHPLVYLPFRSFSCCFVCLQFVFLPTKVFSSYSRRTWVSSSIFSCCDCYVFTMSLKRRCLKKKWNKLSTTRKKIPIGKLGIWNPQRADRMRESLRNRKTSHEIYGHTRIRHFSMVAI